MKPVEFKEQNAVFAEDQPEYTPLPALILYPEDESRPVVSCWRLSFRERLRILFTGRNWVSLLTFGNPLTPSFLSTKKTDHFTVENKTEK